MRHLTQALQCGMPRVLCLLSFFLFLPHTALAAEKPVRIVSMSLCSDEMLLTLADRESIASLTWLAAEKDFSPVAGQVGDIPLNHGLAEEVLAYKPDLILSTRFSASNAVRLLQTLDHEVAVLEVPSGIDESLQQLSDVAALLGETEKGEELLTGMQNKMNDSLQHIQAHQPMRALFLASNGLSYGHYTLRHDFLTAIGWENVATTLGLSGPGILPLEVLLTADPDVVILDTPHAKDSWLAHALLRHPALKNAFQEKPVIILPDVWFQCAGPSLVKAWESLALQLDALEDGE